MHWIGRVSTCQSSAGNWVADSVRLNHNDNTKEEMFNIRFKFYLLSELLWREKIQTVILPLPYTNAHVGSLISNKAQCVTWIKKKKKLKCEKNSTTTKLSAITELLYSVQVILKINNKINFKNGVWYIILHSKWHIF